MFEVEPLTTQCAALLPRVRHVCVGVSPFNSYFSTPRLIGIADWALGYAEDYHFFVPDAAAADTLEALGYPRDRAEHKARRQGQYVRNKVATALRAVGVAEPEGRILGMARLSADERYRRLWSEANALYGSDAVFRDACLDASGWVLDRKLPAGVPPTPRQLRLAVRYFLAELPLFADSGGIAGSSPSVFVYHQRVRFLERFFAGELSWRPADGQGFLVLTERSAETAGRVGRPVGVQAR